MLYSYILCRNYSSKINWLSKGIPLFLLKRKGGDFNSKIIIRSDPLISMHQSLLQLFTRTTIFHWRNCWSRQVVVVRRILYRWRRLASKACFLTPLRAKVTRLGENNFVTLSSCFLARLLVVRKWRPNVREVFVTMRAVENISYCWYVDKKNKPTSPNRCHADQVSQFLFEHLTQVKRSLAMNLVSAGACYVFHLASYPFAKHTVYVANMS